ncbi:hypothetical protein J437_LFUL009374 [Ladona fulva]|uniref:DUF4773 domain-containing protein n=1 Tax=Ladona fulva TaxID=123851 RepID=A0A8K0K6C2_LADFU|nr:hypothetical protein J437_LFUL009374 [Ladona fulva]
MEEVRLLPGPCTCEQMMCDCCMDMSMESLNIENSACTSFGFDPGNFSLLMKMTWNDEPFFERSISGRNPPPLCLPVPTPGQIPRLDSCMIFSDIYFPGQNVHGCFDWEMKMEGEKMFRIPFGCMRMGADGFEMMKPGEEVVLPESDVADDESEANLGGNSMPRNERSVAISNREFHVRVAVAAEENYAKSALKNPLDAATDW